MADPEEESAERRKNTALRKVTKGAGIVFFGTFLQLGLSLLAKALITRHLDVPDYGFISIGIVLLNFGATIALFGLDTGVARYIPRSDSPSQIRNVFLTAYVLTVPASVLLAVTGFVLAPTIAELLFGGTDYVFLLRVFCLALPLWVLMDLGVGLTRGLEESLPRVYTKNILLPLTRLGLVGIVYILGLGALGIASAYIGAYAVAGLFITILVWLRLSDSDNAESDGDGNGGETASWRLNTDLVSFSLPLTFNGLSGMLVRNADLVLLGILKGSFSVGIYNAAYPAARLLSSVIGGFGFLFTPSVSKMHADDEMDTAERLYQVISKWMFILAMGPFLILFAFPSLSISVLFGAKYSSGGLTLSVLTLGFLVGNLVGLNGPALQSVGRSKVLMWIQIATLVVNVALNLWLIPIYSFLGAAIATTVSYTFQNVSTSVILYRDTGIHPFTRSMAPVVGFGSGLAVGLYVAARMLFEPTIQTAFLSTTLTFTLYGALVIRFGGLEREDILMFNAIEEKAGIDLGSVKQLILRLQG